MVLANDLSQEEIEAALKEAMNVVTVAPAPVEARPRRRRVVRRRRGGQPGNQNARKHGIYAKSLTPEERALLQEARETFGLSEEVAVVRVLIATFLADPGTKPDLFFRAMNSLTAMVRLEMKLRTGF